MKKPKITIITPTYNVADTLEKTIISIIGQDYKNIEYIIVDGESSDGTQRIISKYQKYIDKVIIKPPKGVYDAMNHGIKHATGDYINFMNAADVFYEKTTLSKTIKEIKNNPDYDIFYGYAKIGFGDDAKIKYSDHKFLNERMSINHQATFVKTSLYKKYLFSTCYKIASDFHFFHKLLINNYKFYNLKFVIAQFDTNGLSRQHLFDSWLEVLGILGTELMDPNEILNTKLMELIVNKYMLTKFGIPMNIVERAIQLRKELFKIKEISIIKNPLNKYRQYKKIISNL